MRRLMNRLVALVAAAATVTAFAQAYPTRTITLIVPFSAGGPTDTIGRMLGERMQRSLGQTVVVENVVGAGGTIANAKAMQAAPDGYTIEIGHIGTHVLAPAVQSLNVDYVNGFEPIAMVATNPEVIVSKLDFPAKDLKQLVAHVKANPGKVSYSTGGAGTPSHIMAVEFAAVAAPLNIVHYKGAAPAMQDVIAGHVDLSFDQAATALNYVRGGKVRAYAITAKTRIASAPDIPTVDEAGLPGFYMSIWHAFWAPKGTPKDALDRMYQETVKAMRSPELKNVWEAQGATAGGESPAEFEKLIHSEIAKWAKVVKDAGAKVDN